MRLLRAASLALVIGIAGCGGSSGGGVGKGEGPLTVYLSVPLTGARAAQGQAIADGATGELAKAGGRAGGHPIELVVLDDTGGGARWTPVATGANARRATEDADSIAYIGELDKDATATSLPITDRAEIPQVVLTAPPAGVDVDNVVELPPKSNANPGAAAMALVLTAIERAGSKAGDRSTMLDELRTVGAGA
ncbi:MAG: hypothetical protein ACXWDQ_02580 [Solirubrobacterales bacterium]